VQNWFQSLPFECDLQRYKAAAAKLEGFMTKLLMPAVHTMVGRCTLIQDDP
jgi:hypothetical protein